MEKRFKKKQKKIQSPGCRRNTVISIPGRRKRKKRKSKEGWFFQVTKSAIHPLSTRGKRWPNAKGRQRGKGRTPKVKRKMEKGQRQKCYRNPGGAKQKQRSFRAELEKRNIPGGVTVSHKKII